MKKLLLTALIAVSLISSSFAAGEKTVSKRIMNNFRFDFSNIKDVKWTSGDSYVIANFVLSNKRTQAFYDFEGNLIGTASAIAVEQLPVSAKRALAKKYKDYAVEEAISFEKNDDFSYFISITNDKETLILEVRDGQVSFYKKLD